MKKKIVVSVLGVIAAVMLLMAHGLPLRQSGEALLEWVRHAGFAGVLLFVGVYVLSSLCLVPSLMLNVAAGYLWGLPLGMAIVLPANAGAAVTAFVFGRWLARDWAAARVARSRRLSAFDAALGRAGLKVMLLMRLSPVSPFAILNYTLGVTRVRFRDFVIASLFGTVPGTLLYVAIGSALGGAREVFAGATRPWQHQLMLWGVIPLAVAMVLLVRTARHELHRVISGECPADV